MIVVVDLILVVGFVCGFYDWFDVEEVFELICIVNSKILFEVFIVGMEVIEKIDLFLLLLKIMMLVLLLVGVEDNMMVFDIVLLGFGLC